MKYPYLISSDDHMHNWTQFAGLGPDGVNTRLAAILNEKRRAYAELAARGGNASYHAGDLFHVRGKIEPSVFNPTHETFCEVAVKHPDIATYAIPGNHDLEGKNADRLGNAMQALALIDNFCVATQVERFGDVIVVPWFQDLNELRKVLERCRDGAHYEGRLSQTDVIIHAPVNGVIKGIPDHGLEAQELADLGFRRVFAGHYHDHKVFCDGKVISIGATTHQTWNDPGTLAGFLLVYEDRIEHIESAAPKFVDLHAHDVKDQDELKALVAGNYVRFKIEEASEGDQKKWAADLADAGALGTNIIALKKREAVTRAGTTVGGSKTLEASVAEYVENKQKPADVAAVQKLCADLMASARAV